MYRCKLLLLIVPLCLAAGVLLINLNDGARNDSSLTSTSDPGSEVQQAYQAQIRRLRGYYGSLAAVLRANAPDLLPMLEPPKPLEHGYGILPKILLGPQANEPVRSRSAGYSWPWTHHMINEQLSKIAEAEWELERVTARRAGARRGVFEELARSYPQLYEVQQRIDAHIEYNRLWQTAIAANRAAYDRQTLLHNIVIERQAIRDALKAGHQTGPRRFLALEKRLEQREEILARDIEAAITAIETPGFIRIEQAQPHLWTVIVPIYTDIDDAHFVRMLKSEVENIWRVRDGKDKFRVELALSHVPADELYAAAAPPRNGDTIDMQRHIALFPRDGAILTTGGTTTHVYGRALILGPHAIASRVLAHEIGHLLGFKDSYFRGYRDLDRNGFEVLEVVAVPEDIMGAPATGAVTRRHFETILKHSPNRNSPRAS
jgi:hypothetical protein